MDAIGLARELGRAIQEDERFISFQLAGQRNDEDEVLQELITSFNKSREEFAGKSKEPGRSQEELERLDNEVKELYAKIFERESMKNYVRARDELDSLTGFIDQIISGSVNGDDPQTIEYRQDTGCGGGGCGGCTGCG